MTAFGKGFIAAAGAVLLQSLTSFGDAMREEDAFHELHDPRIEELIDEFFKRRVDGIKALNMRPAGEMVRDLVQVFYLDLGVPAFFRIEHDVGPLLARAKTHIGLDFDVGQALGRDPFFELGRELLRTRATCNRYSGRQDRFGSPVSP